MAIKGNIEEREYLEAGRPIWLGGSLLHLTTMDLLFESKPEYLHNGMERSCSLLPQHPLFNCNQPLGGIQGIDCCKEAKVFVPQLEGGVRL